MKSFTTRNTHKRMNLNQHEIPKWAFFSSVLGDSEVSPYRSQCLVFPYFVFPWLPPVDIQRYVLFVEERMCYIVQSSYILHKNLSCFSPQQFSCNETFFSLVRNLSGEFIGLSLSYRWDCAARKESHPHCEAVLGSSCQGERWSGSRIEGSSWSVMFSLFLSLCSLK